MKYHIVRIDLEDGGKLLASFVIEYDRNICLDLMRETFPDCELEGQDDE